MYEIIEKRLAKPIEESWNPIDYSEIPEPDCNDFFSRMAQLWKMEQAQEYSCFIIYIPSAG